MLTTVRSCKQVTVRIYLPALADHYSIMQLLQRWKGYTSWEAKGHWNGISEDVVVLESVRSEPASVITSELVEAGNGYLLDNEFQNEKCFFCTIGDQSLTITKD